MLPHRHIARPLQLRDEQGKSASKSQTAKISKRLKFVADLFNVGNQTRLIQIDTWTQLDLATPNPDYLKPGTNLIAYPYQNPFAARLAVRFEF